MRFSIVSVAALATPTWGHRPMVNGVSCGAQFSTPETAVGVHDISIEWSMNRVVTCEGQMLWLNFDVPEEIVGERLYLSAGSLHVSNGNERASRFDGLRIDAALLGPGLPVLDRSGLPAHAPIPEVFATGTVFSSPDDQSTCDHSEWLGAMDPAACEVEAGACSFWESFGRTWQTVLLDVTPEVAAAGTHHVATWLRGGETGKIWFAVGIVGGREDFTAQFDIPRGTCDCVPDAGAGMDGFAAVGASTDGFYEKPGTDGAVASDSPPEVRDCNVSPEPVLEDYCGAAPAPAATSGPSGGPSQQMGEGMDMGCGDLYSCQASPRYVAASVDMHGAMALHFTGDVELDFVRGMVPHHQGAVDMCAILLDAQESTEAGLVHFCNHIGQEQGIEVRGMRSWLARHPVGGEGELCADMSTMGCGNVSGPASGEWISANHRMHQGMAINFTCDAEVDFVRGMIPHHRGAIEMCEILSLHGGQEDAYLLDLCDNITRVQLSEIMWMSEWLEERGVPRTATCGDTSPPGPAPCEDLFVVSESCHHYGGDRRCRCEDLTAAFPCGSVAEFAGGRSVDTSTVCMRTCGACPAREPSRVGSGSGMGGMHHDMSGMNHDMGGGGDGSNETDGTSSAVGGMPAAVRTSALLASMMLWATWA